MRRRRRDGMMSNLKPDDKFNFSTSENFEQHNLTGSHLHGYCYYFHWSIVLALSGSRYSIQVPGPFRKSYSGNTVHHNWPSKHASAPARVILLKKQLEYG